MKLGEKECDWDVAYFLEHGCYPPVVHNCRKGEVSIQSALEREWREPDLQYMLWQGCRLGSQFDWLS